MRRFIRRHGEGQALVEFALVIPIFLLVVLGLFDLGRAVFFSSTLSNAAREAVRLGIVDQNTANIRQEAIDSASGVMRIESSGVTVEYLDPDLTAGTCATAPHEIGCVVRVEIRYQFFPATPFVGQLVISGETHQPIERTYTSP